jgi:hypothetical protein
VVSAPRVKAYLALAAAFVLGGICSAAGYHVLVQRDYARLFGGDREAFEARRIEAMTRELDLSREQNVGIKQIFRRHAVERQRLMQAAMSQCGAPMAKHRERIDAEVRALLRPEQRPRFEAMRAEQARRMLGLPAASASAH